MGATKFKEWFEKKLTVGAFPYKVNVAFEVAKYDYVINVSDEYYPDVALGLDRRGCKQFWFPMSEFKKDMGLNSIYGAMVTMWLAEETGAAVYLHCHSGNNRSWTVAAAYYYFRTGEHLDKSTRRGHVNKLHQNCAEHMLPEIREMEAFLTHVREDLNKDNMKAGILTLAKVNAIHNF